MERCDVAVVGAGLAGLVCAGALARRGLSVTLMDRKADPGERVRTTGIFVRRTLADFPLPGECLGPPVRRVLLYAPSGRPLELESARDEFRVGRMARLHARLLQAALASGVRWWPSTHYGGLAPRGGRTVLYLERGGRAEGLSASFVVAADGARSTVAPDLGLDANRSWLVGLEEVRPAPRPAAPPTFHCFLDPRCAPGYIGWVVEDGEELHVGVAGRSRGYDPAGALARFAARAGLGAGEDCGRVEHRGGYIPAGGVLSRIACPRGLAVGDAAGAVSPLTAGGLDACLRLSHHAAEVAADLLDGRWEALANYRGERFRPRLASRLALRRLMDWGGRSALFLEAAHGALCLPPLRALARHVFFGRGSFPLPAPGDPAAALRPSAPEPSRG